MWAITARYDVLARAAMGSSDGSLRNAFSRSDSGTTQPSKSWFSAGEPGSTRRQGTLTRGISAPYLTHGESRIPDEQQLAPPDDSAPLGSIHDLHRASAQRRTGTS